MGSSFVSQLRTIDGSKLHQLTDGSGVYLHVMAPVCLIGKWQMYEELQARVTVRACEGCGQRCWFDPLSVVTPGVALAYCAMCSVGVDERYPGCVVVGDTVMVWTINLNEQGQL